MQITGTAHMDAPVDVAWQAFHDPGVLSRTIPGLQSLEATGIDAYKATISAGVASIKGTYTGQVALTEQVEQESFLLRASGAGGPGTISADVRVKMAEATDGGSDIEWVADASVGGAVGGVGQRMLQGVARKMATQFFAAIDADIAAGGIGRAPETPDPAPATAAAPLVGEPRLDPAGAVASARLAPVAVRGQGEDLRAAAFGALIALAGVGIGLLAGRR